MRFFHHKLFIKKDFNKGFVCFFATDNSSWNKPFLKRKFGNNPVFKVTLNIKTSINSTMHETLPENHGLLSFSLLPKAAPGLNGDSFDPGYICLFMPHFIPPGFRQRVQSLVELTSFEVRGKDYQNGIQLFSRILHEQSSGYLYKHDLIRTYLSQILHLALKIK